MSSKSVNSGLSLRNASFAATFWAKAKEKLTPTPDRISLVSPYIQHLCQEGVNHTVTLVHTSREDNNFRRKNPPFPVSKYHNAFQTCP